MPVPARTSKASPVSARRRLSWALTAGWVLASALGIALGALIGSSQRARTWIAPTLEFIRPLPASAVMPLAIALFGLSGGKGGMRNVIVGAILIGIMQNAMTILDIPNLYQNLIKATILLIAIVIDSLVNPRDEQTAQQGDI